MDRAACRLDERLSVTRRTRRRTGHRSLRDAMPVTEPRSEVQLSHQQQQQQQQVRGTLSPRGQSKKTRRTPAAMRSRLAPARPLDSLLLCAAWLTYSAGDWPCPRSGLATRWVRDPADCAVYYACTGGRAHRMPACPEATVYSRARNTCVWKGSSGDDCADDAESSGGHGPSPSRRRPTTPAPSHWSREGAGKGACGYSITTFIVGGWAAEADKWPWQASLQVKTDPPAHRCGAVLVEPSWILTAAHCVYGPYDAPWLFRVVLGESNLEEDSGFEIYRDVQKIVLNNAYVEKDGYPNDVALVKLSNPVEPYEDFANMICLPYQGEKFDYDDECYIVGWGETMGTGDRWHLNELRTHIRSESYCRDRWGKNYVDHSHLCVGDGETGACQGDSGGPLMCKRNGKFYVVGIASWAIVGCRRKGYPNAFTKIPSYIDWIKQNIRDHSWDR